MAHLGRVLGVQLDGEGTDGRVERDVFGSAHDAVGFDMRLVKGGRGAGGDARRGSQSMIYVSMSTRTRRVNVLHLLTLSQPI